MSRLVKLDNALLAKCFAIRLEELIDELDLKSALSDDELMKKNPDEYTQDDWQAFPTLNSSVNFKVFVELRLCVDRLCHRKGISPKYYLNVPEKKVPEEDLDRIEAVFETKIETLDDPVKQPCLEKVLKESVEIGTSDKEFATWVEQFRQTQKVIA